MRRIRLVALDLDGTLLDPLGALPAENLEACRQAARRAALVVATGRRPRKVRRLLSAFDFPYYLITCSGARLERIPGDGPMFTAHHDPELLSRAASVLFEAGCSLLFFLSERPDGEVFVVQNDPLHPHVKAYLERNREFLLAVERPSPERPLSALVPPDVHFMSVIGEPRKLRALHARLEREFPSRFNMHVVTNITAPGAVLDVLPAGVSKWRTLMRLAAQLGISREETAAVGDDENDREMLREAGVSVAMGNASESLKEIADFSTLPNDSAGAAHALRALGLADGGAAT